jgi:hypothetical protein
MLASDPMLFALRQTWLTVSLLTAPRDRVVGARRTRRVLVGGGPIRLAISASAASVRRLAPMIPAAPAASPPRLARPPVAPARQHHVEFLMNQLF